jgi:hypothetical protein
MLQAIEAQQAAGKGLTTMVLSWELSLSSRGGKP